MNNHYVLDFSEIDRTSGERVGGKGANLGELYQVPEIEVPPGFCIATDAFNDFVNTSQEYKNLLHSLHRSGGESWVELHKIGERLRSHLENLEMPASIKDEILQAWQISGSHQVYAVSPAPLLKTCREPLSPVSRIPFSMCKGKQIYCAVSKNAGLLYFPTGLLYIVARTVFPMIK